jgi:hypothetical protein
MKSFLTVFLTFFLLFTPYGLGNEVKSITFASWSKPDVELFYVLPKEINKDTKVLFIIHGNSRGAERYLKLWISSSKNKNVILVAPHFSKKYFPRYSKLNMASASGKVNTNQDDWLTGSIASFYSFFKNKFQLDSNTYLMYGFSGGSQFIHRYLMYGKDKAIEKAAIGSAGWYTFISFQPFPYGIKNMPLEPGRIEWLMSREVLFLLGDEDNDPEHSGLNRSNGAMNQGLHRYERGYNYFKSLVRIGERFEVPFRWRYKVVSGVDHDTKQMSEAAMSFILEDLDYKNMDH